MCTTKYKCAAVLLATSHIHTQSILKRKMFSSVLLLVHNGQNTFSWQPLIGIYNTSCIFFFASISSIKLSSLVLLNSFSLQIVN